MVAEVVVAWFMYNAMRWRSGCVVVMVRWIFAHPSLLFRVRWMLANFFSSRARRTWNLHEHEAQVVVDLYGRQHTLWQIKRKVWLCIKHSTARLNNRSTTASLQNAAVNVFDADINPHVISNCYSPPRFLR